ncbi:type II toxin-antitoxin system Phd/YefM family antitoxin [Terriglobus sp.]|uniref:type II toxin-antitoxin system Phd/YefM family antitoxin n=1 Tax=Terriglobus sp. TaxID=1889013 RepID=UPI003AFFE76E
MIVTAQYAQEHLEELLESADRGEEIKIFREGRPTAKIITMPAAGRVPKFGTGRGEIRVPSDEEWRQMDKELEDVMLNRPLTSRMGE